MADGDLPITPELAIPLGELTYRASRSSGPGGQHVNTSSTRVELTWDVVASPSLTDEQRARIERKLANRISGAGILLVAEGGSRSQLRNREEVTRRFAALLQEALHIPPPRRKTRPSRAAKERRLKRKKRRSETKQLRRSPPDE